MVAKIEYAEKTRIRPLGSRIVVKRIEAEEKTPGGIVIPDSAKEKPKEGRVVALGEGKLLDSGVRSPIGIAENARVLFSAYAGTEIKVDGVEHLILDEGDVLCVIE